MEEEEERKRKRKMLKPKPRLSVEEKRALRVKDELEFLKYRPGARH